MKVLHCITSLEPDGAQQMLKRLILALDRTQFEHLVVSLRERFPLASELEALNARVICLDMKAGVPSLMALRKLRAIIQREKPDLIQGWLYHANCAVSLACLGLAPKTPTVWGVRGSLDPGWGRGLRTNLVIRFSSWISSLPEAITFNSRKSIEQHCVEGYRPRISRYIPNGFELQRFSPDEGARAELREKLNLPPDALMIGIAGRFNRAKDYPGFLRAFRLVVDLLPKTHAVMIGRDVDSSNQELRSLSEQLGISRNLTMMGQRSDLNNILPGLDVFCSSSVTEGFPNVVAEALACAVPCVVTNVGMGAELVQDAGLSVPAQQPEALSQALITVLKLPAADRRQLGARGREKICSEYDLSHVAAQQAQFYREIIEKFIVENQPR